ncbi:MAG: YigZ family protein [Oscillospiraceae bacterium]
MEYYTLAKTASYEITEKKSVFVAAATHCESEKDALLFLARCKAKEKGATHNVYAYVLRDGARTRYSDDGEPSKTAGLPVLEALTHRELTDSIVVVTRYFGGTLLGTGGLVRAYTQSAVGAIDAAGICTVSECVTVQLALEYPLYDMAVRLIKSEDIRKYEDSFAEEIKISFVMKSNTEKNVVKALADLSRGKAKIEVSKPFYSAF